MNPDRLQSTGLNGITTLLSSAFGCGVFLAKASESDSPWVPEELSMKTLYIGRMATLSSDIIRD